MSVKRTTAAAEPVAIPAMVPLEFCWAGVIEGCGFLDESWAVGGGLVDEFDMGGRGAGRQCCWSRCGSRCVR
jgi:hypothetical protein